MRVSGIVENGQMLRIFEDEWAKDMAVSYFLARDFPFIDKITSELADKENLAGSYGMTSAQDRVLFDPSDALPLKAVTGVHPTHGRVFIFRNANGGWAVLEHEIVFEGPCETVFETAADESYFAEMRSIGVVDFSEFGGLECEVVP